MPRVARQRRRRRKFVGSPNSPCTSTTGVGYGELGSKRSRSTTKRRGIESAAAPSAETSVPTIRKLIIPRLPGPQLRAGSRALPEAPCVHDEGAAVKKNGDAPPVVAKAGGGR